MLWPACTLHPCSGTSCPILPSPGDVLMVPFCHLSLPIFWLQVARLLLGPAWPRPAARHCRQLPTPAHALVWVLEEAEGLFWACPPQGT